jgi:hypothetical protein
VAAKVKSVGGSLAAAVMEDAPGQVRKGKWSSRFEMAKTISVAERDSERKAVEDERKSYRPRIVDTRWLDNFDETEYKVGRPRERGEREKELAAAPRQRPPSLVRAERAGVAGERPNNLLLL